MDEILERVQIEAAQDARGGDLQQYTLELPARGELSVSSTTAPGAKGRVAGGRFGQLGCRAYDDSSHPQQ